MSRSARQDPQVVDTVILAVALTQQFTAVTRDGNIAGADEDAFGIATDTGDIGDPVAVVRLGFSPVVAEVAAGIADGDALQVGADGKVKELRTSGGSTAVVIGVAEEAPSADDAEFGAWIDCLSHGREETISA